MIYVRRCIKKICGGLGGKKTNKTRMQQTRLYPAACTGPGAAGACHLQCTLWTRPSLHVCTSELQTEPSLPIIRGEIGRNKHWKHFIVRGLYSRVLLWELCPRRVDLEMVKGNLQVIHYIIILCFTLCIELLYSCGSNPWYLLSSGTIIIFLIASLSYLPCSHFTRACLFCRINEGRKKLNSK